MMNEFSIEYHNEAGTERFGQTLAETLAPGTVIALLGTLGAGKTRLVQAIAEALGHSGDSVSSPTFVLIHQYEYGDIPIYHFDAYRLENEAEFRRLGPDEYFESDGLSFIEWAEKVENALPFDRIEIRIDILSETARKFTIRPFGKYTDFIDKLERSVRDGNREHRILP